MDFNTSSLFNLMPFLFKIFLHLSPHEQVLFIDLFNFLFNFFLKHKQSESSLYLACFLHQKL